MFMRLFIKFADLDKYHAGEIIEATDKEGIRVMYNRSDIVCDVFVNTLEISRRENFESDGMVRGKFNKFFIKKF